MPNSGPELLGKALHPGQAHGQVLALTNPISFWGGVDDSGRISDIHHPQCGASLTGKVVVMTSGRGSSSSTTVLADQIRTGVAPAAIVLADCDTILVIGALVAAELYAVHMPVVQLSRPDLGKLTGGTAHVSTDPDTLEATVRVDGAS